ncbi:MAG TPA: hypothetical protein PKC19_10535, partial [Roseiflexaceae bacterium]|nr:hypothetical protein [Roseiflexaceae bacterium]
VPPNDFWWHMALGRVIVETGGIPLADLFSYTRAGEAFYNQAWLAQLVMYALYSLGGLPLLLIVQSLLITAAYGLLLRLCLLRTGRLRLCVVVLLLATMPLSFDNWTIRPQSYAFPIFVAFLTLLSEYRLGRSNRLWLLPLLMILWVNLHGSFILGPVLIGLVLIAEMAKTFRPGAVVPEAPMPATMARQLIGWGALTTLAMLLNPRGPGVLVYVRDLLSSSQVTSLVTEWAAPTIRDTNGAIFFIFLIGCIVVLTYARRTPDFTDLLLAGALLWLALGATRNIVWFGFVATPLLVTQAATLLRAPAQRRFSGSPLINMLLIGLLGLLLLIGLPWLKPALLPPSIGALTAPGTPQAAVAALQREEPRPQRLFHAMGYGSYLIWAAPEQPVFIDPRIELYPFEQWVDYIDLGRARDVERLLGQYRFDAMLLDTIDQEALITYLAADPAWVERYRDEQTVLFVRSAR